MVCTERNGTMKKTSKVNVKGIFESELAKVRRTKRNKAGAEARAERRRDLEDKREERIQGRRRKRIRRLTREATENLRVLLAQKKSLEFREYLQIAFRQSSFSRVSHAFGGLRAIIPKLKTKKGLHISGRRFSFKSSDPTQRSERVLHIACGKGNCSYDAIALVIKGDFPLRINMGDISEIRVEAIHHTHNPSTGATSNVTIFEYDDANLDQALEQLADHEFAVKLIVREFGDLKSRNPHVA